MDCISIPEFFDDREVFITGATGLIGKVMIEKLLRSCSRVKVIHILVRDKRGKTATERIESITDIPLFEILKKEIPDSLSKINIINGDVTALKLGISEEDRIKLKNVSIIYHIAASVRFDDSVQDAIIMNTRGTQELMDLALTFHKIDAIIHVSTAYCNPDQTFIEEKLYPSHCDWSEAINIATTLDSDTLDLLTPHFSDHFPNTYTFTKGMAEQVCNSYKDRLPIAIYRPAIVSSTRLEPVPGWVDNYNGIAGLLIASMTGLLRCVYCKKESAIHCIPLDDCVKAMIVASWKLGVTKVKNSLEIYNGTIPSEVKYYDIALAGRSLPFDIPFTKVVWRPGGFFNGNRFLAYWRIILTMILPAFLLDGVLKVAGIKPFIVGLQRRIFVAMTALSFFILKMWVFNNEKFLQLNAEILKSDKSDFEFIDAGLVPLDYLRIQTIGARRYLAKEDDSTIPAAKRKLKKLVFADRLFKYSMISLFVYLIIYPQWLIYRGFVLSWIFVNYK